MKRYFLIVLWLVSAGVGVTAEEVAVAGAEGVPVVYIDLARGVKMPQKAAYCDARMRILKGNDVVYEGDIGIKGRGNISWQCPKKPFKVKLAKKADILGLGKNKHWVLLANYYDESLMRNRVAYDLSGQLGLKYMKSTWVDLVLNGRPIGTYQICEHIRVDRSRIDVFDWEDASESRGGTAEDLSWVDGDERIDVTGGYIFELSEELDEVSQFETPGSLRVMVNSPEFLRSSLRMGEYVRSLWRRFESAYMSADKTNEFGERFTDIADLDSMAAYWLTQEVMGNNDAVFKSRYCWKDRGGLLNFGPVWDFDWGAGSYPVGYHPTGWKITYADQPRSLFAYWVEDTEFLKRVQDLYWKHRDYIGSICADGGVIDRHARKLSSSGARNESMWFYKRGFSGPDGDVAVFKRYMSERIAWLDGCFRTVDTLRASLRNGLPRRGVGHGSGKKTMRGAVIRNGEYAGTVLVTVSFPSRGGARVAGRIYGLDGKTASLPSLAFPEGDAPASYAADVRRWGTVSMSVEDRLFSGRIGEDGELRQIGGFAPVLKQDLEFRLGAAVDLGAGLRVDETRLPRSLPIRIVGGTMSARRGQPNPAKVRLQVKKSSGVWKGTFVVYATDSRDGRMKALQFKVQGVFVDGIGYGTARCDKVPACRVPVTVN